MKFNATLIVATLLALTTAVDLRLFKNPNACRGDGIICQRIPKGRCCSKAGSLYGSTQGSRGGSHDVAAPFTKQGNNYCAIQISATKKHNYCFKLGHEQVVGGTSWETQRRMTDNRSDYLAPCTGVVEGLDMYQNGTKTYIISKEKMASLAAEDQEKPTDDDALLEYYKTHADRVIEDGRESDEQVEDDSATERK
jgi:hypothetical protein